jgi:hypothetical protein
MSRRAATHLKGPRFQATATIPPRSVPGVALNTPEDRPQVATLYRTICGGRNLIFTHPKTTSMKRRLHPLHV